MSEFTLTGAPPRRTGAGQHMHAYKCRFCRKVDVGAPGQRYCSRICRHRDFVKSHPDRYPNKCERCEERFKGPRAKFCSLCVQIVETDRAQRRAEAARARVERAIDARIGQAIAREHRLAWRARLGLGRRPRASRVCVRCGRGFQSAKTLARVCVPCVRAVYQAKIRKLYPERHTRGKHEKRAKLAGVPYVYGITASAIFERDRWRCHLCGRKTRKDLKGQQRPRSPEVDHIVPLSVGGSHTWDNVATSCHECNMKKRNEIRGQLRLA
jgi:hypothetical protein